jgi:choline dehydrogenase-like flavoprotein
MNRDGRDRVSSADAWLYPALDRPNLTVRGDALVDRVIVDGVRAVGVDVDGERIPAGEVVLCGGVLQTPALLRRSGIDRPGIGENLSDHPSVPVPIRLDTPPVRGAPTIQTMARLPSPVTGRAFDLQLFPTTAGMIYAAPQSVDGRGRVHTDGQDIRIEWPFLDDARTAAELREGVRLAYEVADGRVQLDLDVTDDAAVDAYVGEAHRAFLHGCGTCAMGVVVDAELRVRGVDGLRICDTSVLPAVPRANPNLTILAVADRAATLF